jgi:hypothetical protein
MQKTDLTQHCAVLACMHARHGMHSMKGMVLLSKKTLCLPRSQGSTTLRTSICKRPEGRRAGGVQRF